MKFNDAHIKIIREINLMMLEGWSYHATVGKLGYNYQDLKKMFTPEEYAVVNNMKRHYDFYRKITPLDKKMPDFLKEIKEIAH